MDFPYFICLLHDGRVIKVKALPHNGTKNVLARFPKTAELLYRSNFVMFVGANIPQQIIKNRWGTDKLIDLDDDPKLWKEFLTEGEKNEYY